MAESTISYEEEKELHHKLLAERDALAEQERQAAYTAVSAALSSYRWWGFSNIINSVRVFVQCWRQRKLQRSARTD